MKKIFILLATVSLCGLMFACGGNNSNYEYDDENSDEQTVTTSSQKQSSVIFEFEELHQMRDLLDKYRQTEHEIGKINETAYPQAHADRLQELQQLQEFYADEMQRLADNLQGRLNYMAAQIDDYDSLQSLIKAGHKYEEYLKEVGR